MYARARGSIKISQAAGLPGKTGSALSILIFVLVVFLACAEEVPISRDVVVMVEAPGLSLNPAKGTSFLLIDEDPNVIFSRVKIEFPGTDREVLFSAFRQAVEGCSIDLGSADENGSLTFRDVAPGSYWVINLDPVRMGDKRIIWAHPVTVGEQEAPRLVRLKRSNAALFIPE